MTTGEDSEETINPGFPELPNIRDFYDVEEKEKRIQDEVTSKVYSYYVCKRIANMKGKERKER